MEGVGWIGAIIIGGIAGWLAEMFMKSNMGVLMNMRARYRGRPRRQFSVRSRRDRFRRMDRLT